MCAKAIDLNDLLNQSNAASGSVSYVLEATEANFDEIMGRSIQYPVILELTVNDPQTKATDEALIELTNAAAGKWLLARVDVQAQPRIAQAVGIQSVPTVVAFIGGQVAPLFQGTKEKAEIAAVLDQVAQAALANGITGRTQPIAGGAVAAGAADAPAEPVSDPRFAPADEALEAGDFEQAIKEFDKLLLANPKDSEAAAGKAQVSLLIRISELDFEKALAEAESRPDDSAAQFAAADVEMASREYEAAFARLIRLVKTTFNEDREQVRARLVDLLSTVPQNEPVVQQARRKLTAALF